MSNKERWALISVSQKSGIVQFAEALISYGFKILASGGTAKFLKEAFIEVKDVAELPCLRAEKKFRDAGLEEKFKAVGITVEEVAKLTASGEMLGHRVVTLIPEVHAGLLARHTPEHETEMEKMGLPYIDLACVDFYTLRAEIDALGSTSATVLEKTDIGGPTMVRSAAKGRRIVICDPADRQRVLDWLQAGEPNAEEFATELAAKVEFTVANYCAISSFYWGKGQYAGILGQKVLNCNYGENAHQTPAALYRSNTADNDPLSLDKFVLIDGKPPSFNNLCDLDRLIQTATHIAATADINWEGWAGYIALGAKHGNVCGASMSFDKGKTVMEMLRGDPLAIFGGLVMLNFAVDDRIAELLLHYQTESRRILDGIIAPSFDESAIAKLGRKGGKCRLLANPALAEMNHNSLDRHPILRPVRGGFLHQPNYTFILDLKDPELAKNLPASADQERDMILAKAICDTSNSNTITLVKNGMLIGNGVGQQSRVACAELAISLAKKNGHELSGAVAASDSFFPFSDGPQTLITAGISAIIGTSGSVKDKDSIDLCTRWGKPFYMIPDTKGRGFFNH